MLFSVICPKSTLKHVHARFEVVVVILVVVEVDVDVVVDVVEVVFGLEVGDVGVVDCSHVSGVWSRALQSSLHKSICVQITPLMTSSRLKIEFSSISTSKCLQEHFFGIIGSVVVFEVVLIGNVVATGFDVVDVITVDEAVVSIAVVEDEVVVFAIVVVIDVVVIASVLVVDMVVDVVVVGVVDVDVNVVDVVVVDIGVVDVDVVDVVDV